MRGRGRGQLSTLGTLLPRQPGRLRPPAGARASTTSNSDAGRPGAEQPNAELPNSAQSNPEQSNTAQSSTTQPNADRTNSADAAVTGVVNPALWRSATAPTGVGRRAGRTAATGASRSTALRYAAWGWPITPSTALAATADLEQVFATWSRLPDAPILAACGAAFDVIETHALAGRTALARLDRLGVDLGPVTIDSAGRIGFFVRADSAAPLSALIDRSTGPSLIGRGAHFELPRTLDQPEPFRPTAVVTGRSWLRRPGAPRPTLPTAHVILGALALVPYRALAISPLAR